PGGWARSDAAIHRQKILLLDASALRGRQTNMQTSDSRKTTRALRRRFLARLRVELRIVWPIVSGLVAIMIMLGATIGLVEGWSLQDSLYFSFVTGLTIGFGDLVPKSLLTRVLAILIGLCGILLTAMIAAMAVNALNDAHEQEKTK